MKRIVTLTLLLACLTGSAAHASPVVADAAERMPFALTAGTVLSDAEMAQITGGQVNVPPPSPGFNAPSPPVGGYIQDLMTQLQTDPGHFSAVVGAAPGFASFVRAISPSADGRGLGGILNPR